MEAKLDAYRNMAQRVADRIQQYDDLPELAKSLVTVMVNESEFLGITDDNVRTDWRYSTYQDLILDLSTPKVTSLTLPDGVPPGTPRECYSNAYELATSRADLTYVEGYALGAFFPVPHAWVEDREGRIIDPTWAALGELEQAAYAGVRFDTEFLICHVVRVGWHSVFASDWTQDAAILRRGFVLGDDDQVIDIGER